MSAAKVKARKMWESATGTAWECKDFAKMSGKLEPTPVFTLPADNKSILRMTTQAAEGLHAHMLTNKEWSPYELTRAALAAIGINARAQKS